MDICRYSGRPINGPRISSIPDDSARVVRLKRMEQRRLAMQSGMFRLEPGFLQDLAACMDIRAGIKGGSHGEAVMLEIFTIHLGDTHIDLLTFRQQVAQNQHRLLNRGGQVPASGGVIPHRQGVPAGFVLYDRSHRGRGNHRRALGSKAGDRDHDDPFHVHIGRAPERMFLSGIGP